MEGIDINPRFEPLIDDDNKLFERYSKSIDKRIRDTFPWIPCDFKLKPVRVRRMEACAMLYDFKIALPDGKFATVSFTLGGYTGQLAYGEEHTPPKEPHFDVDPTPSSTAESD